MGACGSLSRGDQSLGLSSFKFRTCDYTRVVTTLSSICTGLFGRAQAQISRLLSSRGQKVSQPHHPAWRIFIRQDLVPLGLPSEIAFRNEVEHVDQIVVVGASLAGIRACQNLRREGFEGTLTLIGGEKHRPYDRPPLSKTMLSTDQDPEELLLVSEDALSDLDLNLMLGESATSLDVRRQVVTVGDDQIRYEGLIIATGAAPRKLPKTDTIEGVHVLRTVDDALAIRKRLVPGASVVIVGAGFVGSEVAAAASNRGCAVTVVEAAAAPLIRGLGVEMGEACGDLHQVHAVNLRLGVGVASIIGRDEVEGVELTDGTQLLADLVVVGIGAVPNTDWLASSGLKIDDGVVCDGTMSTGVPGVYAVGDVAKAPNAWLGPSPVRVEHWTAATEQAMLVAGNLLHPEHSRVYDSVPFVWSDQYNDRIQVAGDTDSSEHVEVLVGSVEEQAFVTGYRRDGALAGVMALNSIRPFVQYRRLLMGHGSWDDALALAAELS
jgi:NADPH-dependent 2,4-dienoyl-CoA reductase/sulfur reductase-like enzyme